MQDGPAGGMPDTVPKSSWGGVRPGAGRNPNAPERIIQRLPAGPRWYVVQVVTAQVRRIVQDICTGETRPGMMARPPFDAFWPTQAVKRTRLRAGTRSDFIVHEPMIRGYAFVRFDRDADNWPAVQQVDGVIRLFMTQSQNPIPVKPGWVEKLMQTVSERAAPAKVRLDVYEPGAQLRVDDGPFTSFHATCLKCDGLTTLVKVNIFGRDTDVTMARTQLSKL